MFTRTEGKGSVLGICVTPDSFTSRTGELEYRAVHSGRRAIDMLRLVRFDLLLVNLHIPDLSVWNLIRHVKTAWPNQKWALVGGPITAQQEIAARMFDVATIFTTPPAIEDVCSWQTFSDVLRASSNLTPQEVATRQAALDKRKIRSAIAQSTYSKHTSAFEITTSTRAAGGRSSYAKNITAEAV